VKASPTSSPGLFELRLAGVPLCPAWLSLFMRRDETDVQISSTTAKERAMSATATNRRKPTAVEAQFLAPGTPQHAGAAKQGKAADREKAKAFKPESFEPGDLVLIPLSRLVKSPFNVRKTKADSASVTELAALIDSQGLLQNLVVHDDEDKSGKATGDFGVAAGGRRWAALLSLAKAGKLSTEAEITCRFISRQQAVASSMAENSGREPMSVADMVVAFDAMVKEGKGVEEIAVAFGVSVLTVQRRLKLANVSPKLFKLFRADTDEISLDQLMALAITEDHSAQERVWFGTAGYNRHPTNLRRLLLGREVDAATDPLAKFVGLASYEAAGGLVVRNLFEDDGSGYVQDVGLLERLALEKLNAIAQAELSIEGWAWVEARTEFDYSARQEFGAAVQGRREATAQEQKRIETLTAAHDKACGELEDLEDGSEEEFDSVKADSLQAEIDKANEALSAINAARAVWTPEVLSVAGAVVTVERSGKVSVHRGLVKPEDRKRALKASAAAAPGAAGDGAGEAPESSAYPESLVRKLTANKTKALQNLMATNVQVSLAALAAALVQQVGIFGATRSVRASTVLMVRGEGCDQRLADLANDVAASRAWAELAARVEGWRERLPSESDELVSWLIARPQGELLELLALCSALTVDVVRSSDRPCGGEPLIAAVGLDMADWWSPTAASYLAQVPKARIVEAVAEAVSPEKAAPLAKMKKAEAVAAAEELLRGTRWLPTPLRAVRVQEV
jgi:ParB family chromosome partitioning protein